ncbi:replicase [Daphne virus S]|uniref:Replicase n=1 Tax=Daphne virus S TaxID=216614 RepID=Q5GR23_9VIRU|nr:replicase [Daphne virus S]CAF04326.1 replicase [Daphne virus S]
MALTYRSPMEEIMTVYDTSIQGAIAGISANHYKDCETRDFKFFCYALEPEAKKNLTNAGIYLSPFSAMPHSHPVCKTLENYLLYKVLPSVVDNSFLFVGMKQFKLELLKARNSNLSMVEVINRYVTSADRVRYDSTFVIRRSKPIGGLKRHAPGLESAPLKELVPEIMARSAKHLFLHDELHYWSHRDLITMLEVLKPDKLLGTLVYPPELLCGSTSSLYPWCYDFEVLGKDFFFYPDGVRSEGYLQPLKGGFLLSTSKIHLSTGEVYCVDVIQSKFAHHLVCLTKGDAIALKFRSFGEFAATGCKGLSPMTKGLGSFIPVSYPIISRIYRYLRSLKKPDVQSAMSKLSQLVPEPTGIEIKFIQDFANFVIETSTINSMIVPSRLKLFMGKWLKNLPGFIAQRFETARGVCLDDFVMSMAPYTYTCRLTEIDWSTEYYLELAGRCEAEFEQDVPENMDRKYLYGPEGAKDRRGAEPYTGLAKWADGRSPVICVHKSHLTSMMARKTIESFLCERERKVSRKRVVAELRTWLCDIRTSLIFPITHTLEMLDDVLQVDSLIRKILMLQRRRASLLFVDIGALWFLSNFRGFQLKLTNYSEAKVLPREAGELWAVVVAEIGNGDLRKGLKRKYYYHASAHAGKQGRTQDAVQETWSEGASSSCGECNVQKYVSCACGVTMELKSPVETLDHLFQAPDPLRGRRAGWYSRDGHDYNYTGASHKSLGWAAWMDEWLKVLDLDPNYYNSCLYQVYEADATLNWHSDDESLFEKGGRIATVNLSGSAVFHVKCMNGCRANELVGFGVFEMPADFQSTHKHKLSNPSNGRESVTFRRTAQQSVTTGSENFSNHEGGESNQEVVDVRVADEFTMGVERSDGSSASSSEGVKNDELIFKRHYAGVNIESGICHDDRMKKIIKVPGDGDCFWHCVSRVMSNELRLTKEKAGRVDLGSESLNDALQHQMGEQVYAQDEAIAATSVCFSARINVYQPAECVLTKFIPTSGVKHEINLINEFDHFSIVEPANCCVPRAIAAAYKRSLSEILAVIREHCDESVSSEIWNGEGVNEMHMLLLFECFDIRADVVQQGVSTVFNEAGRVRFSFHLEDKHLTFLEKDKLASAPSLRYERPELSLPLASQHVLAQIASKLTYKATELRAKVLSRSLFEGTTGVISSNLFNGRLDLMQHGETPPKEKSRDVYCLMGTFGAGKSTHLANFFKMNKGRMITYVSPRKVLAEDFEKRIGLERKEKGQGREAAGQRKKLGQEHWRVKTFEQALLEHTKIREGSCLILDEIQLYPPGYLDLMCYLVPDRTIIAVAGDPCQSDYDNEKDRFIFSAMEADFMVLLKDQEYKYMVRSLRFQNQIFSGRLPSKLCIPQSAGVIEYGLYTGVEAFGYEDVIGARNYLVSSFEEKKIIETFCVKQVNVLTFGESTGMTFDGVNIVLTSASFGASERRWLTALSRSRKIINFINLGHFDWNALATCYKGRFLASFLAGTAKVEDLLQYLPGKPIFVDNLDGKIGKDEGIKEEKLAGDPWLKGMIDLGQTEDIEEIELEEAILQEPWFKVHLPRAELESIRARWEHRFKAKEHREVRMGYLVSEQFTDEHSKQKGKELTNAATRFEAIYPRHKASDTVTFIMAVKKRLRFSQPAKEMGKLLEARLYGKFLLEQFLKHVPLKKAHNPEMMAQAKAAFELKKTSKSAATIENHANRSCRDWLIDVGLIFSKSQLCTKFDNRFRDAKAAQSIVCFQHEVLCRFAPYIRYIEMKLNEVLPDRFYIHSGKGLEELNDWVLKHDFSGVCTESDYEAFDASQDQYIVGFELAVMEYLGLPRDLINDYIYIKTHLGSKLGSFAIMRFSGEASTFLFNTMANMLFTFLRYEIHGNENICFAGDDMCASKRLQVKNIHAKFLSKLKLKAKVDFTSHPTFCGWNLTKYGIYKKPQLVLERLCIAKETNNLINCIDNYAIEVSYAYKLGELALCEMNEEEAEAMYNCVRIIVKNKHHLKSSISDLFQEIP